MRKKLLMLAIIFILAFFTWFIVFAVANYTTSVALGYETEITRYGVDSEMRHIYKERQQRDFEGNPLPADPVFERHWAFYRVSGAVAVILVGLFGCAVILLSKRDSKLLVHPLKWLWVFMALYLLRTPYVMAGTLIIEWIGKPYCWPGDAWLIGYAGLHPYIFSPVIGIVLLVCLGTALYKVIFLHQIQKATN